MKYTAIFIRYLKLLRLGLIAIILLPIALIERLSTKQIIKEHQGTNKPVFIIGHWRSGTTYLHQLMAQDEQFGFLNNAQAFLPWAMRSGKFVTKIIIQLLLPKSRWDGVGLQHNYPQEEEFAMQGLHKQSAYMGWYYPKKIAGYFNKYVLLDFENDREASVYYSNYAKLINKLAFISNTKRLLIKNPANTGRVAMLLQLYPKAQFIYLHRNEEEVIPSTINMHQQMIKRFGLTTIGNLNLEEFVQQIYHKTIKRYHKEKTLIPKENLLEIAYRDLVDQPEFTLANIYQQLNLTGFEEVLPAFRKHINAQKNHIENFAPLNANNLIVNLS